MEAAMVEMSASAPRERLLAFVGEVVRPLPHVRQRENALLYVRGLVEQGGRKSLQPTLFRLEETPARYESMQQFLADSPWEWELVVRACAEHVAPELGLLAWVVDDTGIVKDGKHSPGVKRQYSGTLGKIGNCQVAGPGRNGGVGRRASVARADREPESVRALAERLPGRAWKTLPCRTTPAGKEVSSRFAFVRVVVTHPVRNDHQLPREEWLIVEWPAEAEAPTDYWLSNLPAEASRERLARLARLRWTIELDYRQLKGELGLDHYEGRSYAGFHHHCALVTCAHAFLTLERLCPRVRRPA